MIRGSGRDIQVILASADKTRAILTSVRELLPLTMGSSGYGVDSSGNTPAP